MKRKRVATFWQMDQRDLKILDEYFSGDKTYKELGLKYSLAISYIPKIIKRQLIYMYWWDYVRFPGFESLSPKTKETLELMRLGKVLGT
jgi:hypothetical protein